MAEGLERLLENARRAVAPPAVLTPRPEPVDTAELALVQQGMVKREDMPIHKADAERAGLSVPDYLLQKHLLTRGDYYQAISMFHKGGIPIKGPRDLPDVDTIVNDVGQLLGTNQSPTTLLLLGSSAELAEGKRQLFLLTTPGGTEGAMHAALISKVLSSNFKIRATLIAQASVLEVVRAEWAMRSGAGKKAKGGDEESEQHAWWDKAIDAAWKLGSSDIHLTSRRGRCELKFRIHGELELQPFSATQEDGVGLQRAMYNTMVDDGSTTDNFDIRAEQDAVVTRHLADGAIRLRYSGRPIEPDGYNVVLRLIPMNTQAKPKSPTLLGYSPDQDETLTRIFARSSGMILFLGTTGSGKSTSEANLLMQKVLDNPGKQLHTIEQPVEIIIPGSNVTQTSVVGTDFTGSMRALLRQDPDYLMVGEIRDQETADLAFQMVRSGHLCVSTLHADGSPVSYDRLAGMGVKRSDMASVGLVAGLIYQRLVATLCPCCKVKATQIEKEGHSEYVGVLRRLRTYLKDRPMDGIYFRGHDPNCTECKGRGVTGRTVCAEILVPKSKMLKAIREGDSDALWHMWREEIDETRPEIMRGRTAFEHALWKMCHGDPNGEGLCSPLDVEKEFKFLDEPVFG